MTDRAAIVIAMLAAVAVVAFILARGAKREPRRSDWWEIGPWIKGESRTPGYPSEPLPLEGGVCQFTFVPGNASHIHYFTKPASSIGGKLVIEFDVVGDAKFTANENGKPARVVPYFAHRDNDWKSDNQRWWYTGYVEPLKEGSYRIEAPLDWRKWTNVYGQQDAAGFQNAVANVGRVGLTFGGGSHYGHGVVASAPAAFRLWRFD